MNKYKIWVILLNTIRHWDKMERTYITATEFRDFSKNQRTLIGILNHNMTKLGNDVNWLKKLNVFQVGVITAIMITVICGFLKIAFL